MPALSNSARNLRARNQQKEPESGQISRAKSVASTRAPRPQPVRTKDSSASLGSVHSDDTTSPLMEMSLKLDALLNGQEQLMLSLQNLGVCRWHTSLKKESSLQMQMQSPGVSPEPMSPPEPVSPPQAVDRAIDLALENGDLASPAQQMEGGDIEIFHFEEHVDLDEDVDDKTTVGKESEASRPMLRDTSLVSTKRVVVDTEEVSVHTINYRRSGSFGGSSMDANLALEPLDELRQMGGDLRTMATSPMAGTSRVEGAQRAPLFSGSSILYTFRQAPQRQCAVVSPEGTLRLALDMMSMALLVLDSILVPYQLTWESNSNSDGFFSIYTMIAVGFWTLDMILGFTTGFYTRDHILIMDRKQIICRYLRGSFPLDIVVVTCDYVDIMLELTGGRNDLVVVKVLRLLKLGRLIRLMASIRAGKVARMYTKAYRIAQKHGYQDWLSFLMNIVKIMFLIVWINHLGGCLWHYIGVRSARSWYRDQNSDLQTSEFGDEDYILYLYWSVTAMVSGASFMPPTSTQEIIYVTCFILFSLIFGSTLISSLAAMLMELEVSNREWAREIQTLRAYLYQNHIKASLAVRIEDEIREGFASEKRFSEADVPSLGMLSSKIRAELWVAVYGPGLVASRLFMRAAVAVDELFLKNFCQHALLREFLSAGFEIFKPDLQAIGAYFVHHGFLEYQLHDSAAAERSGSTATSRTDRFRSFGKTGTVSTHGTLGTTSTTTTLAAGPGGRSSGRIGPGRWVSEVALWTTWVHCGWMEVATPSEVLTVTADSLIKVLHGHPEVGVVLCNWAASYCAATNRASSKQPSCLTDLCTFLHEEDLLPMVPLPVRIQMSSPAFSQLSSHLGWTSMLSGARIVEDLGSQIREGSTDVLVDSPASESQSHGLGRIVRIVSIVVLNLESHPGNRLLVHLGNYQKRHWIERLSMPGVVVQPGESIEETTERLLDKLGELKDHISFHGEEMAVEERVARISKACSVVTRIRKTILKATIDEEVLPELGLPPLRRETEPGPHHSYVSERLKAVKARHINELSLDEALASAPQTAASKMSVSGTGWMARHAAALNSPGTMEISRSYTRMQPMIEQGENFGINEPGGRVTAAYLWMGARGFEALMNAPEGREMVLMWLQDHRPPIDDEDTDSTFSASVVVDSSSLGRDAI